MISDKKVTNRIGKELCLNGKELIRSSMSRV
jgi:hypothetical protein